tara:strand:- start:728 stop:1516 length:789 start_codon:yes stop_codon:yes gene_type:complete
MLQVETIDKKKSNFNRLKVEVAKVFPELNDYELEKIVERNICTNVFSEKKDIEDWFKKIIESSNVSVEEINVNDCDSWNVDKNGNISHDSGGFFKIIGLRTKNSTTREVGNQGWDQPIVSEINNDGGILGLVRSYIEGLPHYLVEAKFEPGNYGFVQLSPTLQATFSNINKAHGGRLPNYYEFFKDYEASQEDYLFNQWLNEDGGRLNKKRNRGLVKNVAYEDIQLENQNFAWLSFHQINQFINQGNYVNPHLARLIYLISC